MGLNRTSDATNAAEDPTNASARFAAADPQAVWDALVEDSGRYVAIVDGDGRIVYINRHAWKDVSVDATGGAPESLHDLFSPEIARERAGFVRRVASTGRPLTIDGFLGGRLVRMIMRAMPSGESGDAKVFVMGYPMTEEQPTGSIVQDEGPIRAHHDDLGRLAGLTDREREVLKLIGFGLSTSEIADRLHRSVKTVEWHRASLGGKLGVTNRVELARIAIATGIASLDSEHLGPASAGKKHAIPGSRSESANKPARK